MADDHYSRPPRPNNPFARPHSGPRVPQQQPAGDPLAELARLIGQADPYAAYAQTPPSPPPSDDSRYGQAERDWRGAQDSYQPQQHDPYAQQHDPYAQQSNTHDGYGANAPYDAAPGYQDQAYPAPHAPSQGYGDPRYGDQSYNGHDAYGEQAYPSAAPMQDPHYAPQSHAPQQYAPQVYGDQQYVDPQYSERAQDPRYADQQGVPQFASPQYDNKPYPAYDNQLYAKQAPAFPPVQNDPYAAQQPMAPGAQGYSNPYYSDPNSPAYGAPYFHENAQEPEEMPARRRGGLVTVLAVLALAVVGTAGAFGYRAVFSPSGTRVAPPVIKADTNPSKIVPAANDSKPIQDRVGDRAQIERIINREEQPVDVNAARAGAPRVVFPGPNPIAPLPNSPIPQSPASVQNAPAAAQPAGNSGAASTEPRKIRTVTIRSDQPELASAAAQAAIPAPRASNVPSGVLPDDNAARAQASASATSPLSLAPAGAPAAQRQAPPPVRTAAVPPPAAAGSGGYGVQVTSQRSESEAQAAYAQLQSKFPSVLGNRQAVIRRADLGEKGTYYRAQIMFGSQSEASDFCTGLKNAGGQCIVQRN